ncbi:hypothetical protein AB1N83_003891 [Pleurotus pulmonarius]
MAAEGDDEEEYSSGIEMATASRASRSWDMTWWQGSEVFGRGHQPQGLRRGLLDLLPLIARSCPQMV